MCTGVYHPRTRLYRFVSTAPRGYIAVHVRVRTVGWPCHNHAMNAQPLILVVDDDREIRTLLSEYLCRQRFSHAGGGRRRGDVESS